MILYSLAIFPIATKCEATVDVAAMETAILSNHVIHTAHFFRLAYSHILLRLTNTHAHTLTYPTKLYTNNSQPCIDESN